MGSGFLFIFFLFLLQVDCQQQKVLYGSDDRLEPYNAINDPNYGELFEDLSRASALIAEKYQLYESEKCGSNFYALASNLFVHWGNSDICQNEQFYGQPNPGFCSGFLVSDDVLVTAGHCVQSEASCEGIIILFNFEMLPGDNVPDIDCIPKENVRYCDTVIDQKLGGTAGYDHSIVRLTERVPSKIGKPVEVGQPGEVALQQNLVLVGHPYGLPKKISPNAEVKSVNPFPLQFGANVDAYSGNSGSLVASLDTGKVIGFLVAGNTDFIVDQNLNCAKSNVCSVRNGCQDSPSPFELCSKVDSWEMFLPNFEGLSLNFHGRIFIATLNGDVPESRVITVELENSSPVRIDYDAKLEKVDSYGTDVSFQNGQSTYSGSVNANGNDDIDIIIEAGHVTFQDVYVAVHDSYHGHDRLFELSFIQPTDVLEVTKEADYTYTTLPDGTNDYRLHIHGEIHSGLERELVFACALTVDQSTSWQSEYTAVYAAQFTEDLKLTIDTMDTEASQMDTVIAIASDIDAERQLFDCNDDHPYPPDNIDTVFSYLTDLSVEKDVWYFFFVTGNMNKEFTLTLRSKKNDFFHGAGTPRFVATSGSTSFSQLPTKFGFLLMLLFVVHL